MFCQKCGSEINEGQKFCGKCGNKIEENNDNNDNFGKTDNKQTLRIIIAIVLLVIIFIMYITMQDDFPESYIFFNFIFLTGFIIDVIYIIIGASKGKNHSSKDSLITDMELHIAQLEINPSNNKRIKIVSEYMENNIMPNETILAAAPTSDMLSGVVAVITDKRLIYIGVINRGFVRVYPLERINNVMQNGQYVYVNDQFIVIPDEKIAAKFVSLLNNTISSTQNIGDAIKIENKIVTEETIASQLSKLSELHKANVLTDYEYSIKKQELLDKMK